MTAFLFFATVANAEVKVVIDRNDNAEASADFKFKDVASPSSNDTARRATVSIIDGHRDRNSAELSKLTDGEAPEDADQPSENVFFDEQTDGGRILFDLGSANTIKRINTYSWHAADRGPQVYVVYGSDGRAKNFDAAPKSGIDPEKSGWTKIASVDTRSKAKSDAGGQYGVSISDSSGAIGEYRYLLFDIRSTEDADDFGNTFFSEIDVISNDDKASAATTTQRIKLAGKFVTIDATQAPDLKEWAQTKLLPVCDEWYPIIVKMLPSKGYTALEKFTLEFRNNLSPGIPAYASGGRIVCNTQWFRENLNGEARGAVVHEMVHIVQSYDRAKRDNAAGAKNPGWMVEGIADYIRWYKYEPESHGANIRDPSKAKFDASYRVTANFLSWVTETYEKDLIAKTNAAMRDGKYNDELWKQLTGKTVEALGEEWKASLKSR
ncbi:MAG: hypothetical protein H7Z14_03975 [Anaerolineae bacterium]|nr:hypothetical protein [Phycisphaerae bacterium]